MDTYDKLEQDYKKIKQKNFEAQVFQIVRPEVWKFALLMEQQLKANDYKAGWKNSSPAELLPRIEDETLELEALFFHSQTVLSPENVGREAADVANFAMMIADVCGGLREE